MRSNRLVLAAAAGLAACLVPASAAWAQSSQPEPIRAVQQEPDLIDVSFDGGTLADFVQALRQAIQPAQVNVILRNGADAIEVPPVTLRNVTIESAFDAICPRDRAGINAVQKFGAPIYVIEGRGRYQPTSSGNSAPASELVYSDAAPAMRSALRIYSVKDIVSGDVPLQGIMSAVKTALAVQNEEPQPELLFHEDSGVLIVRGTEAQHVVVAELLNTLERDAERARGLAEREANMALVTQERVRGMKAEIEQTQLELDLKRSQIAQLQQASQQGLISDDEFRQATMDLKQTELRVRHMQAELEAARQQQEAIAGGHTGVGREAAPSVEGSSRFTPEHPEQVRALIDALVHITRGNPETRIVGFEMQDDRIVVRYAGSKEGVEHLAHVCKLIELLDQAD